MADGLLHALLRQAALLSAGIALLWALRPLLLRQGAGLVYASWLLVPVLLLTPALPRPAQEPVRLVLQAALGAAPAGPVATPPPATPLPALPWLWLGGAAMVLAVQAWRQWRLARLGAVLPAGSSPALVGLLRPRVALPVDFEERFAPAEQALILAHEQVHRERLDNLWNLVGAALAALHWWNPLAWWALRRMRADQELACDAAVLRKRPQARADYTQALLAAHGLRSSAAPLASRWGSVHPLIERIAMLESPNALTRRKGAALAALLLGLAGSAYALQMAPGEPPAADATLQLRYELQLSVDGQEVGRPRLITPVAKPSLLAFSNDEQTRQWLIQLQGRYVGDKELMIDSEIRLNEDADSIRAWQAAKPKASLDTIGQRVASPKLLVKEGEPAAIEVATPDGQHRFRMNLRVESLPRP
jgi:beta-lactamase regulating signal transducer with metallopeptidase domain